MLGFVASPQGDPTGGERAQRQKPVLARMKPEFHYLEFCEWTDSRPKGPHWFAVLGESLVRSSRSSAVGGRGWASGSGRAASMKPDYAGPVCTLDLAGRLPQPVSRLIHLLGAKEPHFSLMEPGSASSRRGSTPTAAICSYNHGQALRRRSEQACFRSPSLPINLFGLDNLESCCHGQIVGEQD